MEYTLVCKIHGMTAGVSNGSNKVRCKLCRTAAVKRRRKKVKILLIEYAGGKCVRCGYNKCPAALEFHHKDSREKDFGISANGDTKSLESLKVEADKCILLCSNCHRELHWEENIEV